ncbi:MAG: DNA polymerase III subunit delta [Gaiellaceae bacterium]
MPEELKSAYLFSGNNRPRIEEALQRLRERFGRDAVERFQAAEASGEEVVAACNTSGLFSGDGRALIVEGVERWKAADVRALGSYLESPAPGTVLVLVAGQLKRDSALAMAVGRHGQVISYDLAKGELPGWIASQLRERGVSIGHDAARALVTLVGEDAGELAGEIDKLASWADGQEIDEEAVELLVPPRGEVAPFGLTEAWGRRDRRGVLAAYEVMLERSSDPRSSVQARMAAMLASHVGKVRACQRLAAAGVRPRDAAAKLGMHPYAAERAFAHARTYSEAELRAAIVRLSELDLAIKGESRLPGDLELERALIDLTAPE